MKAYWVEGLYFSKQALRRIRRKGRYTAADLEPFAMAIWATSGEEALQIATEKLQGGEWHEPPTISQTTEEQRMRAAGAPELPLFSTGMKRRKA